MKPRKFDHQELGSIDRFQIMLKARMDYLMMIRRLQGRPTCNAGSIKSFCFAVADHAFGEANQCTVSQATMQAKTGLEPATQYRVAKVLEDCGLMECDRRSTRARQSHYEGRTNLYRPNWAALDALASLTSADVIAAAEQLGKLEQLPKSIRAEMEHEAPCKLQDGQAEKHLANCKMNGRGTLQTARRSPCKLQDGTLQIASQTTNKHELQKLTTNKAAGAAVKNSQDANPVCVFRDSANGRLNGEGSNGSAAIKGNVREQAGGQVGAIAGATGDRSAVLAQLRLARQIEAAKQALRDAGVWDRAIGRLLAIAAQAAGGNPLPRVEQVIAAANAQADRHVRANKPFRAAAWICRAIEDQWEVTA